VPEAATAEGAERLTPSRPASRPPATRGRRALSFIGAYQSGGLLVALIALGAFFTSTSSHFLTTNNLKVVLLQVALVGIIAIPGSMLLLSGYLDLSVGSVAVLAAAVFGEMAKIHHTSIGVAVVVALAVGAAWGALNGVLVAYLRFSPVVVTLGGFAAARGVAEALTTNETRSGFGDTFGSLGNGTVLGLPAPAALFIVLFAIGVFLWYATPLGRHLTAIGADETAARSVGVSVKRIPFATYVFSGLAAAVAGLILTSELDGASPSIGQGLELEVLTAILLGGVAFSGGRGSLWGVLFGVLFIGVLQNGLVLLNVGPYYVNIAVGAVLLLVAGIDVLYQRLERIPLAAPEEQAAPPGAKNPASASTGDEEATAR
jgi:ribose/xylose/arabinose/galactoside ABC-type transport system permease subunit